jgi:hypothetical protein
MSRSLHRGERYRDGYSSRRPSKSIFHRDKKYTHRCERRNQRAQVEAALEDHQEYLDAKYQEMLDWELDQQFREEMDFPDPDDWIDEWEESYYDDYDYYER